MHYDYHHQIIHIMMNGYFNVFKSIKNLEITQDSMPVLPKLPVDILFDSTLKDWSFMEAFKADYKQFQLQCKAQEKRIKQMIGVGYMGFVNHKHQLPFVDAEHLYLEDSIVNLDQLVQLTDYQAKHLRILTLADTSQINIQSSAVDPTRENAKKFNIDTLKLIRCKQGCSIILQSNYNHKKSTYVNDALNLTNSLRNLTLTIYVGDIIFGGRRAYTEYMEFEAMMKIVVSRKYHHHLQNVNISISIHVKNDLKGKIDEILNILGKNNKAILKQQFNQFKIGLYVFKSHGEQRYFVFDLNSKINDDFMSSVKQSILLFGRSNGYSNYEKQFEQLEADQFT